MQRVGGDKTGGNTSTTLTKIHLIQIGGHSPATSTLAADDLPCPGLRADAARRMMTEQVKGGARRLAKSI
ncbi:MAG: hypothetical protein JNM13_04210 [Hyphomicrobiaceae bacterium]|nr:hypothetical protein [Hyphomicrobiaceae bacterium]